MQLLKEERMRKLKNIGVLTLIVSKKVLDKSMNVLIWEIDADNAEITVIENKIEEKGIDWC